MRKTQSLDGLLLVRACFLAPLLPWALCCSTTSSTGGDLPFANMGPVSGPVPAGAPSIVGGSSPPSSPPSRPPSPMPDGSPPPPGSPSPSPSTPSSPPPFSSPPGSPSPSPTCITGATGRHSSCVSTNSPKMQKINMIDQNTVLTKHNTLRASVRPTPNPALTALQWNQDLAKTAERLAAQCSFAHDQDPQRTVPSQSWGKRVGQNLYATATTTLDINAAIQSWYNEISSWTYGASTNDLNLVGHFTQIVANRTLYVGCGSATCTTLSGAPLMKTVFACNYGPAGNVIQNAFSLGYPYWSGVNG